MKQKSICLECGKEFEYYPSEKDGKYCSQECYKKSRGERVLVKCENCGKELYRKISGLRPHVFCSNKCRAEKNSNRIRIVCKVCGTVFYKRESITKNYKTECCSRKCRGIARRNRSKKVCKYCGVEFEIKESAVNRSSPRGAYCSFDCYHKYSRGKNSHMYDHGQTFYPYCERFNNSLRERVRYFFGNECVLSGKTKSENNNKRLDVHHVFIEKLACCESKIEDMDLIRKRLPKNVARFGLPEFTEEELMYIRMMVPLAVPEHAFVHKVESNDTPYEETIYRRFFAEMIIKEFNGRCYFTEEEFKKVKAGIFPT